MRKSSVALRIAHSIKDQFETWSEALEEGWRRLFKILETKIDLIEKLKSGLCLFSYVKKSNGQLRKACGTLDARMFKYESKGTGKKKNWNIVTYFDMAKDQFRSFCILNLQ